MRLHHTWQRTSSRNVRHSLLCICNTPNLLEQAMRRRKLGSPSGIAIPVPAANYPLCRFFRAWLVNELSMCAYGTHRPHPIVIISALPAQFASNYLLDDARRHSPTVHGTYPRDYQRQTCLGYPAPPLCTQVLHVYQTSVQTNNLLTAVTSARLATLRSRPFNLTDLCTSVSGVRGARGSTSLAP